MLTIILILVCSQLISAQNCNTEDEMYLDEKPPPSVSNFCNKNGSAIECDYQSKHKACVKLLFHVASGKSNETHPKSMSISNADKVFIKRDTGLEKVYLNTINYVYINIEEHAEGDIGKHDIEIQNSTVKKISHAYSYVKLVDCIVENMTLESVREIDIINSTVVNLKANVVDLSPTIKNSIIHNLNLNISDKAKLRIENSIIKNVETINIMSDKLHDIINSDLDYIAENSINLYEGILQINNCRLKNLASRSFNSLGGNFQFTFEKLADFPNSPYDWITLQAGSKTEIEVTNEDTSFSIKNERSSSPIKPFQLINSVYSRSIIPIAMLGGLLILSIITIGLMILLYCRKHKRVIEKIDKPDNENIKETPTNIYTIPPDHSSSTYCDSGMTQHARYNDNVTTNSLGQAEYCDLNGESCVDNQINEETYKDINSDEEYASLESGEEDSHSPTHDFDMAENKVSKSKHNIKSKVNMFEKAVPAGKPPVTQTNSNVSRKSYKLPSINNAEKNVNVAPNNSFLSNTYLGNTCEGIGSEPPRVETQTPPVPNPKVKPPVPTRGNITDKPTRVPLVSTSKPNFAINQPSGLNTKLGMNNKLGGNKTPGIHFKQEINKKPDMDTKARPVKFNYGKQYPTNKLSSFEDDDVYSGEEED